MVENVQIQESKISRIYKHLSDESQCAIISTYRGERSLGDNKRLFKQFKNEVRDAGLGYIEFVSRWVEDGEAFDEESLLIPGCSLEQAKAWGTAYDQASVIYKDEDGCREICTNDFETYTPYNVVRVFNNVGPNMLNLSDAKEIFERRRGGPASGLKKGDKRAFTLTVDEKYGAKPSVFRGPSYVTVFKEEIYYGE